MAGKSVGQILGTVAGAVIGFFAGGNVALGASIGGAIGGAIDPPKGPKIEGPRLSDLSVQTSTYGAPIARAYGTVPIVGNVFWIEGDAIREVTKKESQGGKGGGGGSQVTTYSYFATWAVMLAKIQDPAQTATLLRMWIDTDLVYDASGTNDASTIASAALGQTGGGSFKFYSGADDQKPNARMQADKGVANVSAYPGMCYIVLEDWPLEKYSNTLMRAQVKCEIVISGQVVDSYLSLGSTADTTFPSSGDQVIADAIFSDTHCKTISSHRNLGGAPDYLIYSEVEYGVSTKKTVVNAPSGATPNCYTHNVLHISHNGLGFPVVAYTYTTNSGGGTGRLMIFNQSWEVLVDSEFFVNSGATTTLSVQPYAVAIDKRHDGVVDIYLVRIAYRVGSGRVHKLTGGRLGVSSALDRSYHEVGISQSYVITTDGPPSAAALVIRRYDKDTLAEIDSTTYSGIQILRPALKVVGDNDFDIFDNSYAPARLFRIRNGLQIGTYRDVDKVANDIYYFDAADNGTIWLKSLYAVQSYGTTDLRLYTQKTAAASAKLRDVVTQECSLSGVAASSLELSALTNSDVRGFIVAGPSSPRSALEPLRAAWPFDVSASGYKVRFVSRGAGSIASIPEIDLGANEGGKQSVILPMAREMDTVLPQKTSVKFLDACREYDIGEQFYERPSTVSVVQNALDLPIVMTSAEAAQVAEVLNEKEWAERVEFGPFSLPPSRLNIEALDVVTVTHFGQNYDLRITRTEASEAGVIECNAVLTSAQSYVKSATGESPLTVGQSLVPLYGSTTAIILDIPRLRREQDAPGMAAAIYGMSASWPGGSLLSSPDSGTTFDAVASSNQGADVLVAGAAIGAGRADIVDSANVLTLTAVSPGISLASVTFAAAAAGGNLAAYGTDGRWEIISFLTATDLGGGAWRVSDLVRGRFGSEAHMTAHQTGDCFVILDSASIQFFGLDLTAYGQQRVYSAVTDGATVGSGVPFFNTYAAVSLKPLAPARVKGCVHPSTFDFTASWDRVSRSAVEPFCGISTPLGETSESYEVEFWDSGFANKKRTITGLASASVSYSKDEQIADFGTRQTTFNIKVYQISSLVGRGYPLSGVVTHSVFNDTYIDYVKCLIHCDDIGLTDVMAHAVTLNGNAQRAADATAFGGYCAALDGAGDWLYLDSVDFSPGAGDFTIEVRCNPANVTNSGIFQMSGTAGGFETTNRGLVMNFNSGGGGIGCSYAGNDVFIAQSVTTNTWHHFAMSRSGTTLRIFYDGNLIASYGDSTNYSGNRYLVIGGYYSSAYVTNGKFEEFRLTKFARYTAAFTPPTTAFYDD